VAKLPLNVSRLTDGWKEVSATTGVSAGLVLAGDPHLVALAQERFATGGTLPGVWARPLAELAGMASVPGEVLVLLLAAEAETEAMAGLGQSMPGGGVVLAVDEGPAATGKTSYPVQGCARLSFSDTPHGWRRLFDLCVDRAGDNVVALGRRYPVLRPAAARRVTNRAAGQNALIGAAIFIPGADMPVMTLNQAKMVLSIAGIYGEEIGKERVLELVAVAGAGFGLRALARSFLRSTPGVGWAIKACTGYTATIALGLAARRYFEMGAPASTSRVLALAGSLRR